MATDTDETPSFWVRAMFDYHSNDDSSLSFSRGDIVEVLTQLESGWWDGLIGSERGWFPSNFVAVISEEEAEAELKLRGHQLPAVVEVDPAQLDTSGSDSEWLQDELEHAAGSEFDLVEFEPHAVPGNHNANHDADLWLPEVEPNGQIVYVNPLGQRLSDLPAGDGLEDITAPEVAPVQPSPLISHPVARQRANTATTTASIGGFTLVARGSTPEPWRKRMTDDGAFVYENRVTGKIAWSLPDPGHGTLGPIAQKTHTSVSDIESRLRYRSAHPYDETVTADADVEPDYDESDGRDSDPVYDPTLPLNHRTSVYSDVSEVNPLGPESPFPRSATVQDIRHADSEPRTDPVEVQRRLEPPPSETIEELSVAAQQAIDAVSQSMAEQPVPGIGLVAQVIVAVRNLLYVSGTLAQAPAALAALVPGDSSEEKTPGVSPDLRQFQRRVTATLSKLVLSARAADSTRDSGQDDPDARARVAHDAGELDSAVVRFVVEVRRVGEEVATHRLRGTLGTPNVGRGMPGGGIGGRWRGSGFVRDASVGKALNVETCDELHALMGEVERGLIQIESDITRIEQGQEEQGDGVSEITSRGRAVIAALCALLTAAEDVDVASKVGQDIELRRGTAVGRLGSRDKLRRMGSGDQLRRIGSRDELTRAGSRDNIKRKGSQDELRRAGSRDELRSVGSRDRLGRMGSRGNISRVPSGEALSRPGSKSGRSPAMSPIVPLPTSAYRSLDTSLDVRRVVRRLEIVKQVLYDTGITLLLASQTVHVAILKTAGAISEFEGGIEVGRAREGESALSLVKTSIESLRRSGREMLAHYDALARTDPPEAYIPITDIHPSTRFIRPRADTHRTTEDHTHTDNSHTDVQYRNNTYSRTDHRLHTSDSRTLSRPESYDVLPRTDPGLTYSADSQTTNVYRIAQDNLREPTNGGRSRAGSVSRELTREIRLDSVGSGRGTYSQTYPERGVNGRFLTQPVDSAVSLPNSDTSTESSGGQNSKDGAAFGQAHDKDELDSDEDGLEAGPRSRPSNKHKKILGPEAPAGNKPVPLTPEIDPTPWYLKPTYNDPKHILTNTDGGVRGGTLRALVERLTMHDQLDASFIDSFLMTYKSFTTIQELFELLVERFRITPPDGLTPKELEEWVDKKQTPARVRVVNIFRKILLDPSVIDREDYYILDQIKSFAKEIVGEVLPAQQLIVLVDRAMSGDMASRKLTMLAREPPPQSILPRSMRHLQLLDIDATELARQLTILESRQYNSIKPIECLARARDEPAENDSIKTIIMTTNKIASWVAHSVLDKSDARHRANIIKQFINVAERCRNMHNYSSMAALIAGLNSPPIRRLKRSWDTVSARHRGVLDDVESTLDSGKNFAGYRQRLKQVDSACVPFLGVYLTMLTFIQDGNKDFISKEDGIINFGKRQKTAEVIREIQGYQSRQYSFAPVDSIQNFIETSLGSVDEKADYWDRSLEVEPRERDDEKMTRILQESGFL